MIVAALCIIQVKPSGWSLQLTSMLSHEVASAQDEINRVLQAILVLVVWCSFSYVTAHLHCLKQSPAAQLLPHSDASYLTRWSVMVFTYNDIMIHCIGAWQYGSSIVFFGQLSSCT
jgi:hypothetical protein